MLFVATLRKTICNWLCVPQFATEVDRLSLMINIASRSERLRIAMRAVRQRVREDGTIETDRDVLDWLKFAQTETTGIKLKYSRDEVEAMDATELIKKGVSDQKSMRWAYAGYDEASGSQ